MTIKKLFGRGIAGLGLVLTALVLAGCATDEGNYKFDPLAQNVPPASGSSSGDVASTVPMAPVDASQTTMHKGDKVSFAFSDTPNTIQPIQDTVKEDGTVTLIYNEKFQADGKTIGALQQEIHDRYVPKYFKYLTVTIEPQERFYYVGGEVRTPSRQVYSGRIFVLGAIDTAGGFTEWASKKAVQVTRANGESFTVNCVKALKNPELNKEIFPGDKIEVKKRLF